MRFYTKRVVSGKDNGVFDGAACTDIDQYHRRNDNHNSAEWIWCNAEWNDNRFYGEKVYLLYFGIYHYKWRYVFHICSYDQK